MSTATDDDVRAPVGLPAGRIVGLPDGGEIFVRADLDGPDDDRIPVLLVHGWTVTADTTFAPCYPALAERYRVVAPDLRGHGRSSPARHGVRLDDLADDCAAVLDALGVTRAVVVGYSLGGAVAQLVWHRHRDRVAGLVLCSTARHFQTGPVGDLWYRGQSWIAPAVRAFPGPARARMVRAVNGKVADGPYAAWYRQELLRSDPPSLLRVGAALGRFRSNRWIGAVDVPTAAVVTTRDRTVPTRRQRGLAAAIPGCRIHEVAGPHNSAVVIPDVWVPQLHAALDGLA
ncbi:MAG TPA: alpha/beta fold hydrolase [Iamia sp.]